MSNIKNKLIGFIYNSSIPETSVFIKNLIYELGYSDCNTWSTSLDKLSSYENQFSKTSLVVIAGGDGSILKTVRSIYNYSIPILGINFGKIGFMTELDPNDALEKLPEYINGRVRIEERMMLEASIFLSNNDKPRLTINALNDVVIGNGGVTKLSDIEVSVDDNVLTIYRSDAVVVSTATGSTGYSYSAGGPILHPESNEIILQPVAPHTGLRDSIVLPRNSKVTLRPIKNDITIVSADGDSEIQLNVGEKLVIKSGIYSAKFLRSLSTVSFYNTLANKLGLFNKS